MVRSRGWSLLVVCAILGLALCGSARGAVSLYRFVPGGGGNEPRDAFAVGPVLAGDVPVVAAWLGGKVKLWLGDRELELGAPAEDTPTQIAASASLVAVHLQLADKYTQTLSDDVIAMPIGGAPTLVHGCGQGMETQCGCYAQYDKPMPTTVAAVGTALAFSDNCRDAVTVIDPFGAPGARPTILDPAGGRAFGFAMSGGLIAEATATTHGDYVIHVLDRASGALEQSYPLSFLPNQVLFQDDGTVLVGGHGVAPVLMSPDRPAPRPAPVPAGATVVGLAAGRIAYVTGWSPEHIDIVDLAGKAVASTTAYSAVGDVGFDGGRLTWAVQPCAVAFVGVWDLQGRAPVTPPGPCPLPRIAFSRPIRAGARSISVEITCPAGAVLGCSGALRIRSTAALGIWRSASRLLVRGQAFALDAGASTRMTTRLRHSIARHRPRAYRFRATATVPGSGGGAAPPARHRSITAVLPRTRR
jgi:hypothetical protein